jgi:hypothetical protein
LFLHSLDRLLWEGRRLDTNHYRSSSYSSVHIGDFVLLNAPQESGSGATGTDGTASSESKPQDEPRCIAELSTTSRSEIETEISMASAMAQADVQAACIEGSTAVSSSTAPAVAALGVPLVPRAALPTPLLSVLLPVLNGRPFLAHAISSILAQQGVGGGDDGPSGLELLVVDDGSTDGSADVVRAFAAMDSRVTLLQMRDLAGGEGGEEHGIVAALNTALEKARGVYVARMDADDVCLPGRFMTQLRYFQSHAATATVCMGILGGGMELIGDSATVPFHSIGESKIEQESHGVHTGESNGGHTGESNGARASGEAGASGDTAAGGYAVEVGKVRHDPTLV